MNQESPSSESSKEWKLIESLLNKSMGEQRKARRWGVFFKGLTFVYLFLLLWMLVPGKWSADKTSGEHTAIVDVEGMIAANELANADSIVSGLREAFETKNAKGIILRINSPGGSPVQSGFIYNEIFRLKEKYPDKKVYAAITDLGASGAYYIASAADAIYADQASLVGSIGVISAGFGFSPIMEKVGIERRMMSAGEHKAMLDPFSPIDQKEVDIFEKMLEVVHQQFIDSVRKGRGDRLKEDKNTFSGLIWTGEQALEIGLVDALGSPGYIAREIIGAEKIVDYSAGKNPFDMFTDQLGLAFAKGFTTFLESQSFNLK